MVMTALPTINVTDAQLARIQAAFTDATGASTPQQVYKKWLIQQIIAYVKAYEMANYDVSMYAQRRTQQTQIDTDFSTGIT